MQRKGFLMISRCGIFQVHGVAANHTDNLDFLFSQSATRQFQMLFRNTLNQSLIEGVGSIQFVYQVLIVLSHNFLLASAKRKLRERCSIPQHQLGAETFDER